MANSNASFSENGRRSVKNMMMAALLSSTAVGMGMPQASAQDDADAEASSSFEFEEIVTVGTRRKARSAADTPAPVDVIGANALQNQGSSNVLDTLSAVVPSLIAHTQPNSGTATSIRPANLRGLSPDATLVLVNGKRRHRAAIVVTASSSNGLSRGSQPVDISTIPSIALKQVEVLRDGAAAQYGADAIAGVINFSLNDDPEAGAVEAKFGKYYDGDGDTVQLAFTKGFRLGEGGHLNISGEYNDAQGTSRTVQRGDAAALIAAGNTAVADPVQIWGSPEISDELKFVLNMSVEAGENSEFYAFAGYSEKRTDGTFFYRNPNNRGGTFNNGNVRLVGDLTPYDGQTCLGGYNFETGVRDDVIVGTPEDDAAIAAAIADPNCWVFNEMFPGGFTPWFGSNLSDMYGTTGMRGEFDSGLTYDFSMSLGRNEVSFDLTDSINASLGPDTPRFFKAGFYVQREAQANLDLSYEAEVGLASPLNIAGGFEWREEMFQIGVADAKTFEAGILGNPLISNGINQGFEARLNGFAPFRPEIAGKNSRHNVAAYLDLEADVTDDLIMGAAVRFEDFSDFGSQTTFKISGLYKVTDAVSLRSSYSTGFRAPTIGQQNFTAITTTFGPDGNLVSSGTVPPTSGPALLRGGGQLQPETSDNITFGVAYSSDAFDLTVDYFNIKMDDRITQSGAQSLSAAEAAQLEAEGYSSAGLTSFNFFTNDFSSTTQGIDVVATVPINLTDTGNTNLAVAFNWTKTEVTSDSVLLGDTIIQQIEGGLPSTRGNATLTHSEDGWRAMLRVNHYGSYDEAHLNSLSRLIQAGSKITIDAEVGVNITDGVEFVLGAQNLLNTFPAANPWAVDTGAKYSITSPFGFNGGFYYGKVRVEF